MSVVRAEVLVESFAADVELAGELRLGLTCRRPLPQGIAYYDLPPDLIYRMPPPPPRHRYVRVGSDILLLSIGSGIVVDAMIDIGR